MTQPFRLPMAKRAGLFLAVALVCGAFALKALGLIDATSLWSDELYTVSKSFQPDYGALLAMLRQDTHPPLYYSLLWLWGAAVGQSAVSLRLLSWLAYGLGAVVMVAQARQLAPPSHRQPAMALAALLAFCSPYPVRFAIEGKSYALLVLLVALGWWLRSRLLVQHSTHRRDGLAAVLYGLVVAAAGLTHFYGLFVFTASAVWDGWRRRWRLMSAACLGMLPAFFWIAYASAYLFSSRSASWIGTPDFALLEDTLARALGPWPLPKLVMLALVLWCIRSWGLRQRDDSASLPGGALGLQLADSSALIPSALMVLGVVALSFAKPMAFSRYFVVLLPAVIPWLAVRGALLPLSRWGQRLALLALTIALCLWWYQSFLGVTAHEGGSREADNFRAISSLTAAKQERYSPRPHLFNLSDRMEMAAGRLSAPGISWGGAGDLQDRLTQLPLPERLWLAASGPEVVTQRRLQQLQQQVERAGLECKAMTSAPPFTQLLHCQ